MANINDIPKGYAMTGKLNLRADPREYRRWNLFSLLTGLVLIAAGWLWQSFAPLQALLAAGFSVYALRILALAVGLVIAAAFPYVVYVLRDLLDIEMPVNLVFLLMFCFVLVVLLSLSIAISQLADKCKRLTQANAMLEKRVRDLEEKK